MNYIIIIRKNVNDKEMTNIMISLRLSYNRITVVVLDKPYIYRPIKERVVTINLGYFFFQKFHQHCFF